MAKWKYEVGILSQQLRSELELDDASAEHCKTIGYKLLEIVEHIKRIISEDDMELWEMDLDDITEDIKDFIDYEVGDDEDENEENTNYMLNKLYDLTDVMRVWLSI